MVGKVNATAMPTYLEYKELIVSSDEEELGCNYLPSVDGYTPLHAGAVIVIENKTEKSQFDTAKPTPAKFLS